MAEMTQSEKMKAYWAEKKAREAVVAQPKVVQEAEEKPVEVETRPMPFTLEPIAPIPTDRETFDGLVAQMAMMTSGGARETIIDQNRALLLRGIAQGWHKGTWMERKEKKDAV
jgi:hypothetical protein